MTLSCPHCQQLKRELQQQNLPDLEESVVFIYASSDSMPELSPEIADLEQALATQFPVLWDSAGVVSASFHVSGVPTAYQVAPGGRIRARASGVPRVLKLVGRQVDDYLARVTDGD